MNEFLIGVCLKVILVTIFSCKLHEIIDDNLLYTFEKGKFTNKINRFEKRGKITTKNGK